jgi:cytosol alanyl aminopeptidase
MRALLLPAFLMTISLASAQTKDPLRLGREITPTFQSIHLTVDPRHPEFSGQTTIELTAHQTVSQFRLHARDMKLDRVSLHGKGGTMAVTHESSVEKGLVTAKTAHPLAPGAYTLEIDFSAKFNTQAASLYRMETGGAAYAFTQFESDDARGAFPCWDEPEFKYPFQLTLTVPRADLAVTNTPIEKETVMESVTGEYKIVVFKKTPPLPTYLLAIAVGPLESVPVADLRVPGLIIAPRGQAALTAEAVKVTAPILTALEKYFGRPYPYEKLDQIAVPEFWPGAMENAGLVTYADSILLVDSRAASVVQKRNLVAVMAHELSHMWFGDLVTMEWWDDLWLNESFASWMGDKITHQLYPELSIDTEEIAGADRAMLTDAKPSTRAIRQPVAANENFLQAADELAYQKGQRVLGMFERWIGPEKFRQGVVDYLKAHEWKNAAAADLWKAFGAAAGKDINTPMATFLDQGGVPLVSVEPAKGGIMLRQHRFLNHSVNAPAAMWQIPVVLKFSAGGPKTILLTSAEQFVPLEGTPAWVHPNAGEEGYYRWTVPAAMLEAMSESNTTGKANGTLGLAHLDLRERVGLITNVSALLDAGEIHGDEYLRVLGRFANDDAPQVINSLLNGLSKVESAFLTPELEEAYAAYLRKTLGPALHRWGLVKKAGEPEAVSFLRPRLLYRLANEGRDAALMSEAQKLGHDYMHDPASIDPALATNALRLAAIRGDAAMFDDYRQRFETTQIPADRQRYLVSLGEFRDPALVTSALTYALDGKTRPQEVLTIPSVVSEGDLKNEDLAYEWMTGNYEAIVKRIPPDVAAFLPQFAEGCSEERLERAKAFFADPKHQVEGTQKELAKVADSVTNCVSLRKREGAAVAEFLRKN